MDFEQLIDRRQTDSIKWNVRENELPMWVADMDFPTAPEIVEAFAKRLQHPVFGYSKLPEEWFDAYLHWWKQRHEHTLNRDSLLFCTGVVPAISSVIRKLTAPGDQIVMLTPIYNHFYHCIRSNGRHAREVEMLYDKQTYQINFAALEQALSEPNSRLMILCNPQNPTGSVWSREELCTIGELCKKYHVTVISDEIHCDIITPGKSYIPFAAASEVCKENSITCMAPTKAFNLAGLQTAALSVPNQQLYGLVKAALEQDELSMPNSFATTAAIAAFTKGADWLDALNQYLYRNKLTVKDYLERELPQVKLVWGDATYLLWLDCTELQTDSTKLAAALRKSTGLFLMPGSEYGKGGTYFFRMNIACPGALLTDGLERLKQGVMSLVPEAN